jgi:hypothetical protein
VEFEYSSIVVVARELQFCFAELNIAISPLELEKLSCFINDVYGTRNRAFHDVKHALSVGEGCSALGKLAALMHDVVYLQIDHSRLPELRSLFGIFDPKNCLELVIPFGLEGNFWAEAVVGVFGFNSGEKITTHSGLNEFLSAWAAIQKLSTYLNTHQLLAVVAGIEATIPFRGDQQNPSVSEALEENLEAINKHLSIGLTYSEIRAAVLESVKISNNDIQGFGLEEPENFIHSSWALLYEGNPALQNSYFTITEYREPLQRLETFYSNMKPTQIFLHYESFPQAGELTRLQEGAHRNLTIGKSYVRAKLLDTAILEAFAFLSGGDAPLEFFTGPKPSRRESKSARIEQFLNWDTVSQNHANKDERVIRLLNDGRAFRSKFDVRTALFAAYLYLSLTHEQMDQAYTLACRFFKREITPQAFLAAIPDQLVFHIGEVIGLVAWTRADAINKYLQLRKDSANQAA